MWVELKLVAQPRCPSYRHDTFGAESPRYVAWVGRLQRTAFHQLADFVGVQAGELNEVVERYVL
jgi:hypothetical protein